MRSCARATPVARRHTRPRLGSPLRRMDLGDVSSLVDQERQTRQDEVAIDLEDRNTKKGTPPVPSESGDIRQLRGPKPATTGTAG